jgi:hypothetical protein
MTSVMQDAATARPKRPIWVWLISLFYIVSAGWTLLSFALIWTGVIPLEAEQKAYFARLSAIDYAATIIIGASNFIGAIMLFLLRKAAVGLFLTALILTLALTIWQSATKGWVEAMGGPGLVGALIGYAILLAVCVYAWHLSRKGVLR